MPGHIVWSTFNVYFQIVCPLYRHREGLSIQIVVHYEDWTEIPCTFTFINEINIVRLDLLWLYYMWSNIYAILITSIQTLLIRGKWWVENCELCRPTQNLFRSIECLRYLWNKAMAFLCLLPRFQIGRSMEAWTYMQRDEQHKRAQLCCVYPLYAKYIYLLYIVFVWVW